MKGVRRFRMTTSFHLPASGFGDKVRAMRRFLDTEAPDMRFPTVEADEKRGLVSFSVQVDAPTWTEASEKADGALIGSLGAAGLDAGRASGSVLDDRVTELSLA